MDRRQHNGQFTVGSNTAAGSGQASVEVDADGVLDLTVMPSRSAGFSMARRRTWMQGRSAQRRHADHRRRQFRFRLLRARSPMAQSPGGKLVRSAVARSRSLAPIRSAGASPCTPARSRSATAPRSAMARSLWTAARRSLSRPVDSYRQRFQFPADWRPGDRHRPELRDDIRHDLRPRRTSKSSAPARSI